MRFLTPAYLFGAALIALPIVLHWLRRDVAPPVPFTAVRLLRQSPIDRSRRRRLRDLLLLAARVLALLLLAGSFARPYLLGARAASRTTVVAVDRSLSMGAPGTIARARALARDAVNQAASTGDRIAVIAFDRRADVVAAPGSPGDARVAIDQIQPGFDGTRYASVFDKLPDLLTDAAKSRLVLVSDLQRSGFDGTTAAIPEGVELVVRDAGSPPGNVAVTAVRVEPRRLVATVRNFGSDARTTTARAEANGRALAERPVTVLPSASADVVFDSVPASGSFDVVVDDPDGYPGDNRRYGMVSSRALPRVLVVTGAPASGHGYYFSKALQAGSDDGADFEVRLVSGPAFTGLSAEEVGGHALIVLLSTHGLDRRARDLLRPFLAAGGGVFVAAGTDVDPAVLSTILELPDLRVQERSGGGVLAATDLRHPIFRPFEAVSANLGQISFERIWHVEQTGDWRVLARYTDGGPALLERTKGPGRLLLFTSDLDRRWNNFPVHVAFVPFVQEASRYLGARPPAAASVLVSDLDSGVAAKPGIVQAGGRMLVVNVDPREGAVEHVAPAEFARLVARAPDDPRPQLDRAGRQAEAGQNYWQYGLCLMLGALIAESFVGGRY
jgi:hypothetical protein